MRYRFRGFVRETGKPVEGHVEADHEDHALGVLSDNGIVTESLRTEPRPIEGPAPSGDPFTDAIESAMDTSSTQVAFDALAQRYKGKSVWVIDREKIKHRMAQVVDAAIAQSLTNKDSSQATRDAVAEAINGLFKDNRNLTSKVSGGGASSVNLEEQIARLGNFVNKAENMLASMSAMLRRIGSADFGGGGGNYSYQRRQLREEQNEVLLQIFKSNLELVRSMEGGPATDAPAQAQPPQGHGNAAPAA